MIVVDVYVPSVDLTYNFLLDEDVAVSAIIEEIIEMVERKEQTIFAGSRQAVNLIDRQTQRVLPKDNTLGECAISTGRMLILV